MSDDFLDGFWNSWVSYIFAPFFLESLPLELDRILETFFS